MVLGYFIPTLETKGTAASLAKIHKRNIKNYISHYFMIDKVAIDKHIYCESSHFKKINIVNITKKNFEPLLYTSFLCRRSLMNIAFVNLSRRANNAVMHCRPTYRHSQLVE